MADIWNLLGASYLKDVVPMPARSSAKTVRSDSVSPQSVNAAYLEDEILPGFIYICAPNSEVLPNRYASVIFHLHVQSTFEKVLACRFTEC